MVEELLVRHLLSYTCHWLVHTAWRGVWSTTRYCHYLPSTILHPSRHP